MGEIADSLIDGEFDFYTGEYIGPGVGYPRSIHGKIDFGGSHNRSYAGIAIFLRGKSREQIKDVITSYAITKGVEVPPNFSCKAYAKEIQKDWPAFVKYTKSFTFK